MAVSDAPRAPRTPNAVLRGIRENERHESQSQFAEAMAQVARETGAEVFPDRKYVQRLESGSIRWPHSAYRQILEQLCGRPARKLGFSPSLPRERIPGEASSRVNVRLREAIWESGMEPTGLARVVGVHPKTVEKWISSSVTPQPVTRWKTSQILGIDESELWPTTTLSQETPGNESDKANHRKLTAKIAESEEQDEMERRRLLQSLAALGVTISPLGQTLETLRTTLGNTVGYGEAHQLGDMEEAVVEYGYSYRALSPGDLIPDLASDLLSVRSILRRKSPENANYRSWCRVGGALSGLMAKSLSNLGQSRDSREWWSMALHLTDVSGDLDLGLWVRSQRIIHGLYENRPFPLLLREIDSAMEFAREHPCAGLADLSAVRAQVSIVAGDYRSAEDYLNQTEIILDRLPSTVTDDQSSVMGWGEAEFRYTQAWVYSHIGDAEKTGRAAQLCFPLYAESDSRSPAQVNLLQALGRIQAGDISEGIRHAQVVYEPLASSQLTSNMVKSLALRVLNFVPAEERGRADVADYRSLVISPSQNAVVA